MGDCRPFTPLQLRYPAPRLPLLPVQGAVPLPVPEQGGSLAALYLYDIYYSFSAQWRHLSLRALKIHFIPGWEENQGTRLSYNFWRTMWHRYRLVSPGTQGMAISQLRLLEMLRISRRIILRHAYAMRPLTLGLSATSRHWCAPLRESNPGRPFPERIDGPASACEPVGSQVGWDAGTGSCPAGVGRRQVHSVTSREDQQTAGG
jgi:hypothetical protein